MKYVDKDVFVKGVPSQILTYITYLSILPSVLLIMVCETEKNNCLMLVFEEIVNSNTMGCVCVASVAAVRCRCFILIFFSLTTGTATERWVGTGVATATPKAAWKNTESQRYRG